MVKYIFVTRYLQPLCKAIDRAIDTVEYSSNCVSELVTVKYRNGFGLTVDVTADSLRGIVVDVLKKI